MSSFHKTIKLFKNEIKTHLASQEERKTTTDISKSASTFLTGIPSSPLRAVCGGRTLAAGSHDMKQFGSCDQSSTMPSMPSSLSLQASSSSWLPRIWRWMSWSLCAMVTGDKLVWPGPSSKVQSSEDFAF